MESGVEIKSPETDKDPLYKSSFSVKVVKRSGREPRVLTLLLKIQGFTFYRHSLGLRGTELEKISLAPSPFPHHQLTS